MEDAIKLLSQTSVPTILIIVGSFLLLIAVGINFKTTVITTNINPQKARNMGIILLSIGILLHLLPELFSIKIKEEKYSKICIKNDTESNIRFDYSWGGGNENRWYSVYISKKSIKSFNNYEGADVPMIIKTPSGAPSDKQKRAILKKFLSSDNICSDSISYVFVLENNVPIISNQDLSN
ncbi:MAG: hypothetical protein ACWA5P_02175 [bacterium]